MRTAPIRSIALCFILLFSAACSTAPAATTPTVGPIIPTAGPTIAPTVAPTIAPTLAPTVAPTASPTAKPAYSGGTVSMNALWEGQGADGKFTGGVSVFKVTVAPKTDPGIRVSFSESEVGGQGAQLRAAGWTAAVMSCLLLGLDPNKLSFTYDISGHADGPSAGTLMTIGTLAAILGDNIPKDFAMTGTINPDGSVGPVGGIPHKIDGAAKNGVKLVLVPIGQRTDIDMNQKSTVDLVRRGEDQGVTVKLVSNIYDAYQLATGKALPRPKGGSRPDLPSRTFDKVGAQATAWLAMNSSNLNHFKSYPDSVRKSGDADMNSAQTFATQAAKSQKEGQNDVALERAVTAVLYSLPADRAAQIILTDSTTGIDGAVAEVESTRTARDALQAVIERLRAEQPKTASDALALMDAYSNEIVAEAYVTAGDNEVADLVKNASKMTKNEVYDALFTISYHYSNAEVFVDITKSDLDMYIGEGQVAAPDLDTVTGLAEMLRRAGEANMASFDSITVADLAKTYNLRDEVAKSRLAALDQRFALALFTQRQLGIDPSKKGLSAQQQTYYNLGGGLDLYAYSTELITKYYSLDATLDKDFNVTGFGREAALQSMLQLADQQSDERLSITKDPPLPAIYYGDNAKVYRDGNAGSKLDALFYYWQSSVASNIFANMTGEYGDKIQSTLSSGSSAADFVKANSFSPNPKK